ncbi:diguanylate cyclase [Marinobacter sp. S6332]|uniref:sensor domain-containing diguanylate cyclase n=1 Tax=Marinobacter sp. S6332 TaxID=2926403 RepID=UPI001FF34DDE|nr:diguanylate cyclase [Marinobacter sp. S6332]MCK0165095.1 diguanylate cyclase [Marinobacter sp. S6332]
MAKMHYKIFLAVSLTILVSEAIFVMINYSSDKEALQTALAQKGQQSQKTFEVALSTTLDSMSQLATFVANSPDVQRLMNEAERATTENSSGNVMKPDDIRALLYEAVSPGWQKMTKEYQVRQLHFHLGPGSNSFLRIHKPDKFGDNMDNLRHLVVDVNRDGQPRQGFELGRVYAGLRGVVPVFSFSDPKKQVGALEVGTSFSTLIESLSSAIGYEVAIVIRKERVDEAVWKRPAESFTSNCGCFVEASSSDNLKAVLAALENKPVHHPTSEGRTTLLKTQSGPITLTEFALRDYIGIRDKHEPPLGRVMIWQPAEYALQGLYRDTWVNIVYAIVVFILIELALYFGMRLAMGKLEATIKSRTSDIRALNSKLEEMANKDVLTGVYSRRYLMERVQQELNRASRGQYPAVILMLDVDNFKQINDNWGHQTGDRVLTKLGSIMMEHARNYDVVGRYGGEEFAILIPGANAKTGYQVAEKLRLRAAEEIKIPSSPDRTITVSVGVASYRTGYRQEDWFAAADAALYAAKRAGKNRVIVSERDENASA